MNAGEDSRTIVAGFTGVSVKVALIMHRLIIRSRESIYTLARHAHKPDRFRLACDKLRRRSTFVVNNFASLSMNWLHYINADHNIEIDRR